MTINLTQELRDAFKISPVAVLEIIERDYVPRYGTIRISLSFMPGPHEWIVGDERFRDAVLRVAQATAEAKDCTLINPESPKIMDEEPWLSFAEWKMRRNG